MYVLRYIQVALPNHTISDNDERTSSTGNCPIIGIPFSFETYSFAVGLCIGFHFHYVSKIIFWVHRVIVHWVPVDCIRGYDADMMTVEYCRGFQ